MNRKIALLSTFLLVAWVSDVNAAEMKAPKPSISLGQLISDPRYLRNSLGSKALVVPDSHTGKFTSAVNKAILEAHLNDGIEFYSLPTTARPPVARVRQAPSYPANLRNKRIEGEAHFLMTIGADGKIKGLYCHQATDPAFATAAAAAIAQWLFVPAQLEKQPVPVLAGVSIKFTLKDVDFIFE